MKIGSALLTFASLASASNDLSKRDAANPYFFCATTGDYSQYACTLSVAPTSDVIVHFSLPPNAGVFDNRAITLSSCAFTFTPTNYQQAQILYVNVATLAGSASGQASFNFIYDIEAPTMNYHKCSGQYTGTRAVTAVVPVPPTYCGISGDPHIFQFSQYTSSSKFDGFSAQGAGATRPQIGITIPAYLSGTFWLLKSTMGLQIQGSYDANCVSDKDPFYTSSGMVPSCLNAVYIQYLDQAFTITIKEGNFGPETDSLLQSYVGPANGNLLTQTSQDNNVF